MPDHLKALIVILVLSTGVFIVAKAPACALAITAGDFDRRRNLWFGITLTAFLAHDFWIYIIVVTALLVFEAPRESNKLAMFFFLLFAVPPISAELPGLGIVENVFRIHYVRLLALAILLPAFLSLWRQPDTERFGRSFPDKLIAGYLLLTFALQFSASTFTIALRQNVFLAFTDVFLPYYVASRSLKNLQGFRDAVMAFAVAALVLSAIAVFEFTRHWLLYTSLDEALGVPWGLGRYQERGGSLRAQGSTGDPIPLGFVMAVAMGFILYLKKSVPNPMAWGLGLVLLAAGLIAPVSRGPWIGAIAILLVFIATGPFPARSFVKLGLLGVVIVPALLVTSAGNEIIDFLPFIGTVGAENVTYRQQLLEVSIQLILENPFFGSFDFLLSQAMQDLKQGGGIIDLVNTYVGVALTSGIIGLSLFSGFFIAVAISVFRRMRTIPNRHDELYLLGQMLLSTLLGILVIIFTVSSVTVIPVIYWSVAGVGVAYARMLKVAKAPVNEPATA